MARVAVLGSNSFAGAAFVDAALGAGHEVLGINRSPEPSLIFLPYRQNSRASAYRFRQLDLNHDFETVCAALRDFAPTFVVDFAGQGMVAESWSRPEQWYQTNIVAKVKLHEFLRTRPGLEKYVRVSTPEVYGSTPQLIREQQPYAPSTPYAVSHAAIDMSLAAFHRNYGFPVILTRFANFFGPGQQLYRIVPRTVIYGLVGRRLKLDGGGTSVRAFIHSRDVAAALLRVLEAGQPGETYHFSPSEFHAIRAVVEQICTQLGVDFSAFVDVAPERPAKDHAYLMDASKARVKLDWQPRITFAEGIRQTIEWVRMNLEEIRRLPLEYVHKP
jgi:dTDP-glucose 4,6-dehydratase